MATFPLRTSRLSRTFLAPLAPRVPTATIRGDRVEVRMGLLGRADVPLERVAAAGTMRWPWWGGVGVRIARGMVAFVASSGPIAVLDLTEPLAVRAPLRWRARRIGVGAEDLDGFLAALAAARGAHAPPD